MASLNNYTELIKLFLECSISAKDFETRYLRLFASDDGQWMSEEQRSILFDLFTDVDAFCSIPEVFNDEQDIDEDELRRCSKQELQKLAEISENRLN
jgi:hypothetical protein